MGDDPLYGLGPGGFPTQGCQIYHWEETAVECRWGLVVPAAGYGNGRGGFKGDRRIYPEET